MVGTAGLIIVLSVFNGFSGLVVSLYNAFDPDIKITPVNGKSFEPEIIDYKKLQHIEGISYISFSLEENALLKYGEKQFIATIKGVDSNFLKIANIDNNIVDGDLVLEENETDYAVVGGSIAYSLGLTLSDPFNVISVYVPKKGKPAAITSPDEAFNIRMIRPSGVFAIQLDFDTKYVLVPLRFARDIIGHSSKVSSIEIGLKPGFDDEVIRDQIQELIGTGLKAETRLQQHEFLYRILKSEKWAVYFILSFILIIAIFNIIGSLTMLIIEKKKDINILKALGAEPKLIRNIFLLEGIMITMSGAITGLLFGGIICFLQLQFGFIKLDSSESFLIDAYPVAMEVMDFVYVIMIVFTIGFLASLYTSVKTTGETGKLV